MYLNRKLILLKNKKGLEFTLFPDSEHLCLKTFWKICKALLLPILPFLAFFSYYVFKNAILCISVFLIVFSISLNLIFIFSFFLSLFKNLPTYLCFTPDYLPCFLSFYYFVLTSRSSILVFIKLADNYIDSISLSYFYSFFCVFNQFNNFI